MFVLLTVDGDSSDDVLLVDIDESVSLQLSEDFRSLTTSISSEKEKIRYNFIEYQQ
jgi:hypothetical protein